MTTSIRSMRAAGVDREPVVWQLDAACVGVDPEVFFPLDVRPDSPGVVAAKAVCGGCPVREVCLAEVMGVENPSMRWGVSGGLSPVERTALHARTRMVGAA